MLLIIYCIAALAVFCIGIIFFSKKKMYYKHKINTSNGIDEEVILQINGIKQYLYIRGENIDNPIILFLHGGPGTSMLAELHVYQYAFEKNYTVVNYDQRSANMSYYLNKKDWTSIAQTITTENLFKDIKDVVDYLLKRFNKKKIIIMGHSWGSVLGMQFAHMYPEITEAYIGIGQVMCYKKSMLQLAQHIKEKIVKNKTKDLDKINNILDELNSDKDLVISLIERVIKLQMKYLKHNDKNDNLLMLKEGFLSPYMPVKYIPYYSKGRKYNLSLADETFKRDFYREYGQVYKCPVILVSGEFDYACIYDTQNFIDYIKAPYKDNIFISNSGHMCMMNNPKEFYNKVHNSLLKIRDI